MSWMFFLVLVLAICLLIIIYLVAKLYKVFEQISIIENSLADIKKGNWNRRILVTENDRTKTICYAINDIAINSQKQLTQLKQSEQAYKRLMTGLSHDVKTPLTSLVGYLEAIQEKFVIGQEKEEYIEVALKKAIHLNHFVASLFDWVKLDANEQVLHLEQQDINELTGNILIDWIPTFEDNNFDYSIDISDEEFLIELDSNAYIRIINNLIQNTLTHSEGAKVDFQINDHYKNIIVKISDDGKGISSIDLPYIFDRLYQSDESRSTNGNGLGLSIAKELVDLHNGTINVENGVPRGTIFTITLPKAL